MTEFVLDYRRKHYFFSIHSKHSSSILDLLKPNTRRATAALHSLSALSTIYNTTKLNSCKSFRRTVPCMYALHEGLIGKKNFDGSSCPDPKPTGHLHLTCGQNTFTLLFLVPQYKATPSPHLFSDSDARKMCKTMYCSH